MADTIYKLPLDEYTDADLIEWINSFPRNKKAEVVRHALRFYKSHLKDGETFIMPTRQADGGKAVVVEESKVKKPRPSAGLLSAITQVQED